LPRQFRAPFSQAARALVAATIDARLGQRDSRILFLSLVLGFPSSGAELGCCPFSRIIPSFLGFYSDADLKAPIFHGSRLSLMWLLDLPNYPRPPTGYAGIVLLESHLSRFAYACCCWNEPNGAICLTHTDENGDCVTRVLARYLIILPG
jgi:hypothetical protein